MVLGELPDNWSLASEGQGVALPFTGLPTTLSLGRYDVQSTKTGKQGGQRLLRGVKLAPARGRTREPARRIPLGCY